LLLATSLVALTAIEVSPPSAARDLLGRGAPMQLRAIAPPPERIAALTRGAIGDPRDIRAVLDLPTGQMVRSPAALLDAAWHGHPTSACYNSLASPVLRATYALAEISHTPRGVAELAAAGFGYVIERPSGAAESLSPTSFPPPARLLSFEKDIAVWGLPHAAVVHRDVARLALVAVGGTSREASSATEQAIDVEVTNRSDQMWSAPRPLEPLLARLELSSGDGNVVFRGIARGVLPLALSPGATTTIALLMSDAPPEGPWRTDLHIDGISQLTVSPAFHWSQTRR
jgi:hypothetical protein